MNEVINHRVPKELRYLLVLCATMSFLRSLVMYLVK
jgi:hypothetical protein